jgi:hypothetical protein
MKKVISRTSVKKSLPKAQKGKTVASGSKKPTQTYYGHRKNNASTKSGASAWPMPDKIKYQGKSTTIKSGSAKAAKATPVTTKKKTTKKGTDIVKSSINNPKPTFRPATEDPNYRELMRKLKSPDESTYTRPSESKKTTAPKKTAPKTTTSGKTVSQIWKDKTGLSWSEAKKLGYSDGSASGNIKLLKKLNSGEINRESVKGKTKEPETTTSSTITPSTTPTQPMTVSAGSGMGSMEREMRMNEESFRRGGTVKKTRKGGFIKLKRR